jgi:large exoprotein involved in heme utilization and adhesion
VLKHIRANVLLIEKPTLSQNQIIPGSSLDTESSSAMPLDNISLPVDMIDAGVIRGVNLFYSFKEFNVGEFKGAYFQNPSNSIQNILMRVTGQNSSEILGTLGIFNAGVTGNVDRRTELWCYHLLHPFIIHY